MSVLRKLFRRAFAACDLPEMIVAFVIYLSVGVITVIVSTLLLLFFPFLQTPVLLLAGIAGLYMLIGLILTAVTYFTR